MVRNEIIDAMPEYQATMRTYRKSIGGGHYDEHEKWICPACGHQNEEYDCPEESECSACGAYVALKFKQYRCRNY